jgi:hypothetical protein
MQEFNFKPKKIMGEGGRGEGYMSGSKNIKTQRWDSYMPCVAMAHSTKCCYPYIVYIKINT